MVKTNFYFIYIVPIVELGIFVNLFFSVEPQIPESVLFADKSLAVKQSRFSRSFTPLNPTEILKEGDIVGVDAEFVTLNQVHIYFYKKTSFSSA